MGMYCYNIALSLGFLLSGLVNMLLHDPAWGWRASVALLAAPGLLLAALLPSISESPQVLMQRGEDAAAVQVRLRACTCMASYTNRAQSTSLQATIPLILPLPALLHA
jgi:MFS family permease